MVVGVGRDDHGRPICRAETTTSKNRARTRAKSERSSGSRQGRVVRNSTNMPVQWYGNERNGEGGVSKEGREEDGKAKADKPRVKKASDVQLWSTC